MVERFGPYELRRRVGRGGMGEVFEAFDTEHDRIVALKRLVAGTANDDEFQKRFRREARLTARLHSPHVIPIHRYGEIDGRLFLDMRLVGGADLEKILQAEGRLKPARAVAIIEQVASALDAAHHAGLVHRDVKPSNVLIDDAVGAHDFVYLVDFGITRSMTGDESAALTGTRTLIGSLDYMAPERFRGEGGVGIDIYALACLLFECLTGSRPFPLDGFTELMTAHLTWTPPTPSRSVPGLHEAFDAVIAAGLAKDPAQRPASAGELAAAARAALDAGTGTTVPSTPTTAAPREETPAPAEHIVDGETPEIAERARAGSEAGKTPAAEPAPAGTSSAEPVPSGEPAPSEEPTKPRRGSTQASPAAAALDVPTTAVPARTGAAPHGADTTTALPRPAAQAAVVREAPGPRTRIGGTPRPETPPTREIGPPVRGAPRPPTGRAHGPAGAVRGAGGGPRSAQPAQPASSAPPTPPRPPAGEGVTSDLRVGDPRRGATPGSNAGPNAGPNGGSSARPSARPSAPSSAAPTATSTGRPAARPAGGASASSPSLAPVSVTPASAPVSTTPTAPTAAADAPAERNTVRTVLWVVLAVLGAAALIAGAVYVAILLTPAAG
ncbi:serine/threonine-protein kinase [Actinomycetospora lemnae]|uniref:non-specific serine/threonine protein kinase n=1 Tax=Actinomycetospora lemnae TaxID=3019891 RepID=A0ABT5SW07_9PSEU|nr:serine/threonine-protein kinase [Actinomycetospora sp. DW7H6]MDD7966964.1 protein kinase [Actinomycetospora sp. DW7H6]